MGGIIIWATVLSIALVFFVLGSLFDGFFEYFNFVNRAETYLPIAALFLAALVGLADDMLGILKIGPHGGGLRMKHKLLLYGAVAALGAWWFYFRLDWHTLFVPFVGTVDFGLLYIPLRIRHRFDRFFGERNGWLRRPSGGCDAFLFYGSGCRELRSSSLRLVGNERFHFGGASGFPLV